MFKSYQNGAFYVQLEKGEKIEKVPVELGDKILYPGQYIKKLGTQKRTSFEMQEGYFLKYAGRFEHIILFTTNSDIDDYKEGLIYYAFICTRKDVILMQTTDTGFKDIVINEVDIFEDVEFKGIEEKRYEQISFLI